MKTAVLLSPLAALALGASPALAAPDRTPPTAHTAAPATASARAASIPFANHGGVDDWRPDGDKAIYFRSGRQWYRATLFSPAFDLPYVEHIGIDAGPSGALDRFGAVLVRGQRYVFSAFDKVAGPPPAHHKAGTHAAHSGHRS